VASMLDYMLTYEECETESAAEKMNVEKGDCAFVINMLTTSEYPWKCEIQDSLNSDCIIKCKNTEFSVHKIILDRMKCFNYLKVDSILIWLNLTA